MQCEQLLNNFVAICKKHEVKGGKDNASRSEAYWREEVVDQWDHAFIGAKILSLLLKDKPELYWLIFAYLGHDVGQLVDTEDYTLKQVDELDLTHADKSCEWLQSYGFSKAMAIIVKYHDIAKIDLAKLDIEYCESLSEDSKNSMKQQEEKLKQKIEDYKKDFNLEKLGQQVWPIIQESRDLFMWYQLTLSLRKIDDMAKYVELISTDRNKDIASLQVIAREADKSFVKHSLPHSLDLVGFIEALSDLRIKDKGKFIEFIQECFEKNMPITYVPTARSEKLQQDRQSQTRCGGVYLSAS